MTRIHAIFEGQAAVITGAGEGIGFEIARQLALLGAKVVLNDIDLDRAKSAAAAIQAEGGQVTPAGGDVAEPSVVRGLIQQTVEAFGKVDIAVANAGVTLWNKFLDYTPEDFNRVIAVNLSGSFFLAQAAARQMRVQEHGGRILLTSSVTAHQAIEYLSVYAMTKAALEMMAKQLVVELSPLGITVNTVAPGATLTPRNLADDPNYETIWGAVTPTGRVAAPTDIANAALFLLSPSASQITGQTIVVDGGWTATSPTPSLDFVNQ